MDDRAFWLIAFVIIVHAIIVLSSVGTCIVYAREIVDGKFNCDPNNRLATLLAEALAAALALSAVKR